MSCPASCSPLNSDWRTLQEWLMHGRMTCFKSTTCCGTPGNVFALSWRAIMILSILISHLMAWKRQQEMLIWTYQVDLLYGRKLLTWAYQVDPWYVFYF